LRLRHPGRAMHVDMAHQSLKEMSDGNGLIVARMAVYAPFELRGMKIEYAKTCVIGYCN
jgi:hypothetical protein